MTENARNLKSLIHDKYAQAQSRIVELAGRAQATLKEGRGKEKLEEVIGNLSMHELLEKLKANRREVLGDVGLATREDLAGVTEALDGLRKAVEELQGRATPGKAELEGLRSEVARLTARVVALEEKAARPARKAAPKAS